MNRILLVRHGQTNYNEEGRLQGWVDTPINKTGEIQAALLARRLSESEIDALYTSDLQRAAVTAKTINMHFKKPLDAVQTEGLREFNYGDWGGLTLPEIEEQFPDLMESFYDNQETAVLPHGESLKQFSDRVQSAVQEIQSSHSDQTILLVTHGGVIRMLLCNALGISLENYRKFRIEPTSLTEILYDESNDPRIQRVNDIAHLQEWVYKN